MTKQKILLSGTRHSFSLELARLLHAEGHEIFSVETTKYHPSTYSNTISKNFVVAKPRENIDLYIKQLASILEDYKIDIFIPLFEEILFVSQYKAAFPKTCSLFFPDFDVLDQLNNKWLFNQKITSHDILAPKSKLIESDEDLTKPCFDFPYILKPCYSRAAQNIYRLAPSELPPRVEATKEHPWVAQEMIEGNKYCSYTICHKGKVHAHAAYPVKHALDQSSCVRFTSVHHTGIEAWVKKFIALENFSGQICFDFIETEDGEIYPIECNPRATSGLHLFNEIKNLDQAFLGENQEIIRPPHGLSKQLAMGMILVMLSKKHRSHSFLSVFKDFLFTKDVIFHKKDLKPFIFQPYLFVSYCLQSLKSRQSIANWFIQDSNWDSKHRVKVKADK